MTDELWLQNLKAGDRVVIVSGYGRVESLASVSKVTATQIVCGEARFRKSNGYAPGTSWDRSRLAQPTTDILERIEERQLRGRIEGVAKDKTTPLATLRAMYAAAKSSPPAGEVA